MPIPAAAVVAAGALASTGASAYAQGKMNKKTRKWNEKMHDITRAEALADWEMTNQYNSPKAQMARYRDAGLNPNLIYGQTNEAGAVRSADTPSWNPRSPSFEGIQTGVENTLSAYYDIQLKEAQIDNLEKQGTVLIQEAALKAASTAQTSASTAKTQFELDLASELKETSLQAAEAQLKKLQADTKVTLDANERATIQQAQSLQEGLERILTSRLNRTKTELEKQNLEQALKNLQKDETLKQLDINLKEKGIQPGDNILIRVAAQWLDKFLNEKSPKWSPKTTVPRDKDGNPYGKPPNFKHKYY